MAAEKSYSAGNVDGSGNFGPFSGILKARDRISTHFGSYLQVFSPGHQFFAHKCLHMDHQVGLWGISNYALPTRKVQYPRLTVALPWDVYYELLWMLCFAWEPTQGGHKLKIPKIAFWGFLLFQRCLPLCVSEPEPPPRGGWGAGRLVPTSPGGWGAGPYISGEVAKGGGYSPQRVKT